MNIRGKIDPFYFESYLKKGNQVYRPLIDLDSYLLPLARIMYPERPYRKIPKVLSTDFGRRKCVYKMYKGPLVSVLQPTYMTRHTYKSLGKVHVVCRLRVSLGTRLVPSDTENEPYGLEKRYTLQEVALWRMNTEGTPTDTVSKVCHGSCTITN